MIEVIVFILMIAALPVYLVFRRRWKKGLNPVSDGFGVILQWTCGMVFFVMVLKGIEYNSAYIQEGLMEMIISVVFSSAFMIFLIYRTARHGSGPGFKRAVAWEKPQPSLAQAAVLAVALGVVFAVISSFILTTRLVNPSTPLSEALDQNQSSVLMVVFLILAILVAPLLEEIVFRGYFFGVIKAAWGTTAAVVVIALLFGLMHVDQYWGDWTAITLVTILGFVMTILRSSTESVIPGVITHYVYNGLVTVLPIVMMGYK